jgi:hypothetical protein
VNRGQFAERHDREHRIGGGGHIALGGSRAVGLQPLQQPQGVDEAGLGDSRQTGRRVVLKGKRRARPSVVGADMAELVLTDAADDVRRRHRVKEPVQSQLVAGQRRQARLAPVLGKEGRLIRQLVPRHRRPQRSLRFRLIRLLNLPVPK